MTHGDDTRHNEQEQHPPPGPPVGEDASPMLDAYFAARRDDMADNTSVPELPDCWSAIQNALEADTAGAAAVSEPDEGLICAYFDGEIPRNDSAALALERRLASSPREAALLADMADISRAVRLAAERLEAACDVDVAAAVMARYHSELAESTAREISAVPKTVPARRGRRLWLAVPGAAAAAAVLFLVVFNGQAPPGRVAETALSALGSPARPDASSPLLAQAPASSPAEALSVPVAGTAESLDRQASAPVYSPVSGRAPEADTLNAKNEKIMTNVRVPLAKGDLVAMAPSSVGAAGVGSPASVGPASPAPVAAAMLDRAARADEAADNEVRREKASRESAGSAPRSAGASLALAPAPARGRVAVLPNAPTAEEYLFSLNRQSLPDEDIQISLRMPRKS